MKKTVTVKEAHDQIVASIGKYGWRPLNDYHALRNIILFGEEEHCYVPNIDQLVSGKTIDAAIASLDNELIVSIGSETVRGYKLNVLSMGNGYVCGWDCTKMNLFCPTLESCLEVIESIKEKIVEKAIESKALYVTGDKDAVEKVADILDFGLCVKMPTTNPVIDNVFA